MQTQPCLKNSDIDSYDISNCRLSFLDASGNVLLQFNLEDLIYYQKNQQTFLNDGNTYRTFQNSELAALSLPLSTIDTAVGLCSEGGTVGGSTGNLTVTPTLTAAGKTIAEGAKSVDIAVPTGVSADVDGVTFTGPISIALPPQSFGDAEYLYPEIVVDNVSGGSIYIIEVR